MQTNPQITATLLNISRQYPDFIAWLAEDREKSRDLLEGTGDAVVRGGCLKLKELLDAFKHSEKR